MLQRNIRVFCVVVIFAGLVAGADSGNRTVTSRRISRRSSKTSARSVIALDRWRQCRWSHIRRHGPG